MKTKQSSTYQNSMGWLGLALACGTLTFAVSTQAAKPPPKPPPSPAYVTVLLGGLRSLEGSINTYTSDINNAGQVVGNTCVPGYPSTEYGQAFLLNPQDTSGDGNPDTWFVDALNNATGASGSDGQNDLIIGLGSLLGSRSSQASAVNDLGVVVGSSYFYNPLTKVSRTDAFIVVPSGAGNWYKDVAPEDGVNDLMLPLGSLHGNGESSEPVDINNQGQIVGWCYTPDAIAAYQARGFLLTPVEVQGVRQWFQDLYGDGANDLMFDLGDFIPSSINDSGQIVGNSGGRPTGGQAMLRNPDGSMIPLILGGTQSEAKVINSRGQIGVLWKVDGVEHAGLLTPRDANSDGTTDTWFQDTNLDGVNDLVVDFGSLKGLENSYVYPHGLNDTGSAVGVCWHASGRNGLGYQRGGFLWENGGIQSLQSLTGGTLEFRDAYAINNARQIICVMAGGRDNPGLHACILLPTR